MHARITLTKETIKRLEDEEKRAKRRGNYRVLRRLVAIRLLITGMGVEPIATAFGLAEQTIRNWWHAFLQKGVSSLRYKKPPGRPSRLSKSQKKELKQILEAGPQEIG